MKTDFSVLGYPLPEDIEKLKWYGDEAGCLALIDRRLEEDLPCALRARLLLEREQLPRLFACYTVTPEEAERMLSENLTDWRSGELEQLRRDNLVDWIFVDGQVRYLFSFYENLIKIRSDIAARQKRPRPQEPGTRTEGEIRDDVIARMKKDGGATCRLHLRAELRLHPTVEDADREARVYLPLPVEYAQVQNLRVRAASPEPVETAPPDALQRTVLFSGKAKDLTHCTLEYTFDNHMGYCDLNPAAAAAEQPSFDTGEQLPHIVFSPYLRALAAELQGGETNPVKVARRFYDFLTTRVNYSYMRYYATLPVIPEYCASRLRGDCGVQALTFITLCRIAGIPAQWQSGLYANENDAGSHDWARFYIAPYGWLYVDCSFGGAAYREGKLDRWNFYFGNLDPYRVPLAAAFQQPFQPPMRFTRKDPYDNQMGEAEYADRPMERGEAEGHAWTLSAVLL